MLEKLVKRFVKSSTGTLFAGICLIAAMGAVTVIDLNQLGFGHFYAGTDINRAITVCGSTPCTWMVTGQVNVTSNTTVPANINIWSIGGGSFNTNSGVNLTIGTPHIFAPKQRIFNGLGNIYLPGITVLPVEWVGALHGNVDDTPAFQLGINALSSGILQLGPYTYPVCNLQITKGSVGILGAQGGFDNPFSGAAHGSALSCNNSSQDIIDIIGTPNYIGWNQLTYLTLQRTVVPTGTASGLHTYQAGGLILDYVVSQDSIYPFRFEHSPGFGMGDVRHVTAGWGYGPVACANYNNATVIGFYYDSVSSAGANSMYNNFGNVSSNCSSSDPITSYGVKVYGHFIQDIDIAGLQTSSTSYGIWVEYIPTGDASGAADNDAAFDEMWNNVTCDNAYVTCITVKNIPHNGSIIFNDVYAVPSSSSGPAIDIESSAAVAINHGVIGNAGGGGGICVQNSSSIKIDGVQFTRITNGSTTSACAGLKSLAIRNTTLSTFTNNTFDGVAVQHTSIALYVDANSLYNTISGNTVNGPTDYPFYSDEKKGTNHWFGNIGGGSPTNLSHVPYYFGGNYSNCPREGYPEVVLGPGAGTSPTADPAETTGSFISTVVTRSNCSFSLAFVAGSSPTVGPGTQLALITFNNGNNGPNSPWPSVPICSVQPRNVNATNVTGLVADTNTFQLVLSANAGITASQLYRFNIKCDIN